LRWKYNTGNGIDSSPAIASDGTIYVGSNGGGLGSYFYAIGGANQPSLDHFEFSPISSPQAANVPFAVTIIAKDQYGNVYTDFNSSVNLLINKGTIFPTTTANFVNGVLSNFQVTIPTVNEDVTISAFYSAKSGRSNAFSVISNDSTKGRWVSINNGLLPSGTMVFCIVIDPVNNSIIYAGTSSGIFKSINGGNSWTRTQLTNAMVTSIAIDPLNDKVVYASAVDFYKLFDFRSVISSFSSREMNVLPISLSYAGSNNTGVFKSTDSGFSWTQINNGLTDTNVWDIAIDPLNDKAIYAATDRGGVFKSVNGGSNWTPVNNGLINVNMNRINCVAIDPSDSRIVYAGANNGLFKSVNGGINWTQIGFDAVKDIAIAHTNTRTIYMLVENKGVLKSTDGGNNWTQIGLANLNLHSVIIDPSNTNVVYVSADEGVFKSIDGGLSWSNLGIIPDSSFVDCIAVDPINSQIIYAGTEGTGAFKLIPNLQTIIITLQIGSTTFTVNGSSRPLDSPPIIKNGRTLLPIRPVVEALGGSVSWDGNERKVNISLSSTTIELWIGKNTARVNGITKPIDSSNSKVVPEIINGRMMLPLRFVTENLGCQLQWDPNTQTITITYQG
jgi:photosystem II stability/assembly factor-like uncharacterized protein